MLKELIELRKNLKRLKAQKAVSIDTQASASGRILVVIANELYCHTEDVNPETGDYIGRKYKRTLFGKKKTYGYQQYKNELRCGINYWKRVLKYEIDEYKEIITAMDMTTMIKPVTITILRSELEEVLKNIQEQLDIIIKIDERN
jgi:uncharacterized protein YaaW (UPF0174 family)